MNFVDYLTQYNPMNGTDDISTIMVYKHFIQKEKEVYKTLNMFKQCGQLFAGLVWIPTKYEDTLATMKNDMQL
jgi:hypothetical protein